MDKQERDEIREMMSDVMGMHVATLNGELAVMNVRLGNIEDQTRKTNGRVTELETKPHPIANCPQAAAIKEVIEDVSKIKTERKLIARISAGVAAAVTIIISALKLFFGA